MAHDQLVTVGPVTRPTSVHAYKATLGRAWSARRPAILGGEGESKRAQRRRGRALPPLLLGGRVVGRGRWRWGAREDARGEGVHLLTHHPSGEIVEFDYPAAPRVDGVEGITRVGEAHAPLAQQRQALLELAISDGDGPHPTPSVVCRRAAHLRIQLKILPHRQECEAEDLAILNARVSSAAACRGAGCGSVGRVLVLAGGNWTPEPEAAAKQGAGRKVCALGVGWGGVGGGR